MAAVKYIVAASVILSLASPLAARKPPLTIEAKFADDISTELNLEKDAVKCPIHISNVTDARSDRKIIGSFYGRAIFSPDDSDAWLNSVVKGLESRGISVALPSESSPNPDVKAAEIKLMKAWLSNTGNNMSANIVISMSIDGDEILYRGNNSRSTYWASGDSKVQRALDLSVAQSLDKIAADIHKTCDGQAPTD